MNLLEPTELISEVGHQVLGSSTRSGFLHSLLVLIDNQENPLLPPPTIPPEDHLKEDGSCRVHKFTLLSIDESRSTILFSFISVLSSWRPDQLHVLVSLCSLWLHQKVSEVPPLLIAAFSLARSGGCSSVCELLLECQGGSDSLLDRRRLRCQPIVTRQERDDSRQ